METGKDVFALYQAQTGDSSLTEQDFTKKATDNPEFYNQLVGQVSKMGINQDQLDQYLEANKKQDNLYQPQEDPSIPPSKKEGAVPDNLEQDKSVNPTENIDPSLQDQPDNQKQDPQNQKPEATADDPNSGNSKLKFDDPAFDVFDPNNKKLFRDQANRIADNLNQIFGGGYNPDTVRAHLANPDYRKELEDKVRHYRGEDMAKKLFTNEEAVYNYQFNKLYGHGPKNISLKKKAELVNEGQKLIDSVSPFLKDTAKLTVDKAYDAYHKITDLEKLSALSPQAAVEAIQKPEYNNILNDAYKAQILDAIASQIPDRPSASTSFGTTVYTESELKSRVKKLAKQYEPAYVASLKQKAQKIIDAENLLGPSLETPKDNSPNWSASRFVAPMAQKPSIVHELMSPERLSDVIIRDANRVLDQFLSNSTLEKIKLGVQHANVPMTDMYKQAEVLRVMKKYEKTPEQLTPGENRLLKAVAISNLVNQQIPRSSAFNVSEMAANNADFIAQLALTSGGATMSEKATKEVLKKAMAGEGRHLVSKWMLRATRKWFPELAGLTANTLTAMPLMPMTYSTYFQERMGNTNLQVDNNQLNVNYTPKNESIAKSLWYAGYNSFGEVFTENIGKYIGEGTKVIKKAIGNRISPRMGEILNRVSKPFKLPASVKAVTRYDGWFEELGEEIVNNVMQMAPWSNQPPNWSPKAMKEMFLTITTTSVLMGGMGATTHLPAMNTARKYRQKLNFLSSDQQQNLQTALSEHDLDARAEAMANFMKSDYFDPEQRQAILQYAMSKSVVDMTFERLHDKTAPEGEMQWEKEKEKPQAEQYNLTKRLGEAYDKHFGTIRNEMKSNINSEDFMNMSSLQMKKEIADRKRSLENISDPAVKTQEKYIIEDLSNLHNLKVQQEAAEAYYKDRNQQVTEWKGEQLNTGSALGDILSKLQEADQLTEQSLHTENGDEANQKKGDSQKLESEALQQLKQQFGEGEKGNRIPDYELTDEDAGKPVLLEMPFHRKPISLPATVLETDRGKTLLQLQDGSRIAYVPHAGFNLYEDLTGEQKIEQPAGEEVPADYEQRSPEELRKLRMNGLHQHGQRMKFAPELQDQHDIYNRMRNRIKSESYNKKAAKYFSVNDADAAWTYYHKQASYWGKLISPPVKVPGTDQLAVNFRSAKMETEKETQQRTQQQQQQEKLNNQLDKNRQISDYLKSLSEDERLSMQALNEQENGPASQLEDYFGYEQRTQKTALDESRKREAEMVARLLYARTKTPVQVVNHPNDSRKGWVKNSEYVVNLAHATADTAVHEYSHPIVDEILDNEPALEKQLLDEIQSTREGQKLIEQVRELYPDYSAKQLNREIITEALGLKGAEIIQLKDSRSALARLIEKIANWFHRTFNLTGITGDESLSQLADMIVTHRLQAGKIRFDYNQRENKGQPAGENSGTEKSGNLELDGPYTGSLMFQDALYRAIDQIQNLSAQNEHSWNEMVDRAMASVILNLRKSSSYQKMTSQNQKILEDNMEETLRKIINGKKELIQEDDFYDENSGKDSIGASADEKLEQFMTHFDRTIGHLVDKLKVPKDQIKINLVELMKDSQIHELANDLPALKKHQVSPELQPLKDALLDEMENSSQMVSMVNFFGSIHFEQQYGVIFNESGNIELRPQVMPQDAHLVEETFQNYLMSADNAMLSDIRYEVDNFIRYTRETSANLTGYISDEYLNHIGELMSAITGLNMEDIKSYLSNPSLLKSYRLFENGKFIPVNAQNGFYGVLGKQLFYFDQMANDYRPIKGPAIVQSFLSQYTSKIKRANASNQEFKNFLYEFMTKTRNNMNNIGFIAMSVHRFGKLAIGGQNVDGKRFSSMVLSHSLYELMQTAADRLTDPVMRDYYNENPVQLARIGGVYDILENRNAAVQRMTNRDIMVSLLGAFQNSNEGSYQHFLGQFSDKKTIYTTNAPLHANSQENIRKVSEMVDFNREVNYVMKVLSENEHLFKNIDEKKQFARHFVINFTLNMNQFNQLLNGNMEAYKGSLTKLIKRAQVTISPGIKYLANVKDGVKDEVNMVVANDLMQKGLFGKDSPRMDGIVFISRKMAKAMENSMGEFISRTSEFGPMETTKSLINQVDADGTRTLVKSNMVSIGVFTDSLPVPILQKMEAYMNQYGIDVLAFDSSAKIFDKSKVSDLFYQKVPVPTADEISGYSTDQFSQGIDMTKAIQHWVPELNNGSWNNLSEEEKQGIIQNAIRNHWNGEEGNQNRELLQQRMNEGKTFMYANGKQEHQVLQAINDHLNREHYSENIRNQNPVISKVRKDSFYMQQDLRHDIRPTKNRIPSQLIGNIMTLGVANDIFQALDSISMDKMKFTNMVMDGFMRESGLQQYLLSKKTREADGLYYTLLENWAVNDPHMRKELVKDLANLIRRDFLEVNTPRVSTIEVPDINNLLQGLRHAPDGKNVMLPELAVNIPGIRYAREFGSQDEAEQEISNNPRKYSDLYDKPDSPQLWQVYQDNRTGKWIVPGEPIVSTRVPADDLHSHTVGRARYRFKRGNFTMLDQSSQERSGSDFDGDARYNWLRDIRGEQPMGFKEKEMDQMSYSERINWVLNSMRQEYENPENYLKIIQPINLEAYDDNAFPGFKGIETLVNSKSHQQEDMENPNSLMAIMDAREKNMTGYAMKGITSNLTTVFSYFRNLGIPQVTHDRFNLVKAHLGNLQNLSFDNAKDPKIEKLGFNEVTAPMFAFELITDPRIDRGNTREEQDHIIRHVIMELAWKYSNYSSKQDPIIARYIEYMRNRRSLSYLPESETDHSFVSSVVTDLQEMERQASSIQEKSHVNDMYKQLQRFSRNFEGARIMSEFKKIQKIRDKFPSTEEEVYQLMEGINSLLGETRKRAPIRADQLRQAIMGEVNDQGVQISSKVMNSTLMSIRFLRNFLNMLPGSVFINTQIQKHHLENNTKSEEKRIPLTTGIIRKMILRSQAAPILSMSRFGLDNSLKMAAKAIAYHEHFFQQQILNPGTVAGEHWIDGGNLFLNALTMTDRKGTQFPELKPSFRTASISDEQLTRIKSDFERMPENLKEAFTWLALATFNGHTSTGSGNFLSLISDERRANIAGKDFGDKAYSVTLNILSMSQMNPFTTQLDQIKELQKIFTTPVFKILYGEQKEKGLMAKALSNKLSFDELQSLMQTLGVKNKEALTSILNRLRNSVNGDLHYQLRGENTMEGMLFQTPGLFSFMYNHFKEHYPDLEVFRTPENFMDYLNKHFGSLGQFNMDALGAAFGNAAYLADDARQDTFFHEVAHLYWDALSDNDSHKQALRKLFGWQPGMSEEDREAIDEEIISNIGRVGTQEAINEFSGNRLDKFYSLLKNFWNRVRSVFGNQSAKTSLLLQQMSMQVWNGEGNLRSETAKNSIRYQLDQENEDKVTGAPNTSSEENMAHSGVENHVNSLIETAGDTVSIAKAIYHNLKSGVEKTQDLSFVQLDNSQKIGDNLYFTDPDGNRVPFMKGQDIISEREFVEAYQVRQRQNMIIGTAIHNIAAMREVGAAALNDFKMYGEKIHMDDIFADPMDIATKIGQAVDELQKRNGALSTEFEIGVSNQRAMHEGRIDMVSDLGGRQKHITDIKVNRRKVWDGDNLSAHYLSNHGYFKQGTPVESWIANSQNKHFVQLTEYAGMYEETHPDNRVTSMSVLPIHLIEDENGKIIDVEIEKEIRYEYGDNFRGLYDHLMNQLYWQKTSMIPLSSNINWDPDKFTDARQKKAALKTQQATENLKKILQVHSITEVTAHQLLGKMKLGHSYWINKAITEYGWEESDFGQSNPLQKRNIQRTSIRDRYRPQEIEGPEGKQQVGQLIYASPGAGKTTLAKLHPDFVDSDVLLNKVLFGGMSNVGTFSPGMLNDINHPFLEGMTQDDLNQNDYSNSLLNKVTDGAFNAVMQNWKDMEDAENLLAFKISSLISSHLQRKTGEILRKYGLYDNSMLNEKDKTDSMRKIVSQNIDRISSEEDQQIVSLIQEMTPYENLQNSISEQKASGKNVLTSTLMLEKNRHLFDMNYDQVVRLVEHGYKDGEEAGKHSAGWAAMFRRVVAQNRTNRMDYGDAQWIQNRYALEERRFADMGSDQLAKISGHLSDEVLTNPLNMEEQKISSMRDIHNIYRFGISKKAYLDALKEDPSMSVQDFLQAYADRKLSLYEALSIKDERSSADGINMDGLNELVKKATGKTLQAAFGMENDLDILLGYKSNLMRADEIWRELGTIEEFQGNSDGTDEHGRRDHEKQLRWLSKLYQRVDKLDAINQIGLKEAIEHMIMAKQLLLRMQEEAQSNFFYRPFTILAYQIISDPSFKWIRGKDYILNPLDSNLSWRKAGFLNRFNHYMKLNRKVDERELMIQAMIHDARTIQVKINQEAMDMKERLNGIYRHLSQEERERLITTYGGRFRSQHGRYAFISLPIANSMKQAGMLSDAAVQYIQEINRLNLEYNDKYQKMSQIFGTDYPIFVPDVMAAKGSSLHPDEFEESFFAEYGIDISGPRQRRFRNQLYKALSPDPSDGIVFNDTREWYTEKEGKNLIKGKNLGEIRNFLFDPEVLNSMAKAKGLSLRDALKRQMVEFNKIKKEAISERNLKYRDKIRKYKIMGGFNPNIKYRTRKYHEATIIHITSLISNYHISSIHPFAEFVEQKYKENTGEGNSSYNASLNYVTSYIDHRIFKANPQDIKAIRKIAENGSLFLAWNSLGLNWSGQVANFSIGQLQNMIIKPELYKKGLSRLSQFPKVVRLMQRHNIGTILSDVYFTTSQERMAKMNKFFFFLTENVENMNQGLIFLGSLTDQELDDYNNDGTLKEGRKGLSVNRLLQIEEDIREIHGDYGYNRSLYSNNLILRELGRFFFSWVQTQIDGHIGQESMNYNGVVNRSVLTSATRGMQKLAFSLYTRVLPFKRKQMLNRVMGGNSSDMVGDRRLYDTYDDAYQNALKEYTTNSLYAMEPVQIMEMGMPNGDKKYWYYKPNKEYSFWQKLAVESFADNGLIRETEFSEVDRKNMRRLSRELLTTGALLMVSQAANMLKIAILAGMLDKDEDNNVTWEELLQALGYGWNHSKLKSKLTGDPYLTPYQNMKTYNLTSTEFKWLKRIDNVVFRVGGMAWDILIGASPNRWTDPITSNRPIPVISALINGWKTIEFFAKYVAGSNSAYFQSTDYKRKQIYGDPKFLHYLLRMAPGKYVVVTAKDLSDTYTGKYQERQMLKDAETKARNTLKLSFGLTSDQQVDSLINENKELYQKVIRLYLASIRKESELGYQRRYNQATTKIHDSGSKGVQLINQVKISDILKVLEE